MTRSLIFLFLPGKIALLITNISNEAADAPVQPELPDANWFAVLFKIIMETFQEEDTAAAFAFFESPFLPAEFSRATRKGSFVVVHDGLSITNR
jgi:hypothetical protein